MGFWRLLGFFAIIFLLSLISFLYPYINGKVILISGESYVLGSCFVEEVIDGDTLICDNETIRLLGVNTPERGKGYYGEARDFLINNIENKTIELLRDKKDYDKYNRKLRYVFYEGMFINTEILQEGLATSFMVEDLKYKEKLKYAENYAKINEIKLWEKSRDKCFNCIKLIELNYSFEFFVLENACNFDCDLTGWFVKDDANHFFKLDKINLGERIKIISKTNVWNEGGDRFFMRDKEGRLVLFYEYSN